MARYAGFLPLLGRGAAMTLALSLAAMALAVTLGLGLCLVKTFVELHGGKVDFESAPDRGTTFEFTIPRHSPLLENTRTLAAKAQ